MRPRRQLPDMSTVIATNGAVEWKHDPAAFLRQPVSIQVKAKRNGTRAREDEIAQNPEPEDARSVDTH